MWPWGHSIHMAHGSRRKSDMNSSWEQATLPGWRPWPLSSCLRASRMVLYIGAGTLDPAFCLGLAEEMGFDTGVCHSPRLCSTWIKPLPFYSSIYLMSLAFVVTGRLNLFFCLVTWWQLWTLYVTFKLFAFSYPQFLHLEIRILFSLHDKFNILYKWQGKKTALE